MQRARKTRLIFYLVYLLILAAGAFALYKLVPRDVIDLLRETYLSDNPGGL